MAETDIAEMERQFLDKLGQYWPFASERLAEALANGGKASFELRVEVVGKGRYFVQARIEDGELGK